MFGIQAWLKDVFKLAYVSFYINQSLLFVKKLMTSTYLEKLGRYRIIDMREDLGKIDEGEFQFLDEDWNWRIWILEEAMRELGVGLQEV